MLFLFRQLRRLELPKRSGRYFLYAIGEIVLIVVGILIALQIGNWNEAQKSRANELYLLKELEENLVQESEQIRAGETALQRSLVAMESIRAFYTEGKGSRESFERSLGELFVTVRFFPVKSAYETLKAGGFVLSDNEVKSRMVNYYEYEQGVTLGKLADIDLQFFRSWVPIWEEHIETIDYGERLIPSPNAGQAFEKAVLHQISMSEPNNKLALEAVSNLLKKNEELLTVVREELNK